MHADRVYRCCLSLVRGAVVAEDVGPGRRKAFMGRGLATASSKSSRLLKTRVSCARDLRDRPVTPTRDHCMLCTVEVLADALGAVSSSAVGNVIRETFLRLHDPKSAHQDSQDRPAVGL
jgi:hypothetical protein